MWQKNNTVILVLPVDITQVVVSEEVDCKWCRVTQALQRWIHVACVTEVTQASQTSFLAMQAKHS